MLVAKSIMLGIGLAMDAFSVSLANGLNENPKDVGCCRCLCHISGIDAADWMVLRS